LEGKLGIITDRQQSREGRVSFLKEAEKQVKGAFSIVNFINHYKTTFSHGKGHDEQLL
jgi:hypothetical protein